MTGINEHISFSLVAEAGSQARYHALKTVNAALVNLYWQLGAFASAQLQNDEWGEKTVQQLSDFLLANDPVLKGFDKRGIYRMVQFYDTYANSQIVSPPGTQLQIADDQHDIIVSSARTQLMKDQIQIIETLWKQFSGTIILHTLLQHFPRDVIEPDKNNVPRRPQICVNVPTANGKTFFAFDYGRNKTEMKKKLGGLWGSKAGNNYRYFMGYEKREVPGANTLDFINIVKAI